MPFEPMHRARQGAEPGTVDRERIYVANGEDAELLREALAASDRCPERSPEYILVTADGGLKAHFTYDDVAQWSAAEAQALLGALLASNIIARIKQGAPDKEPRIRSIAKWLLSLKAAPEGEASVSGAQPETIELPPLPPQSLVVIAECSPFEEAELRRRLKLLEALGPLVADGPLTDAQLDAIALAGRKYMPNLATVPFLEWAGRHLAVDPKSAVMQGVPALLRALPDYSHFEVTVGDLSTMRDHIWNMAGHLQHHEEDLRADEDEAREDARAAADARLMAALKAHPVAGEVLRRGFEHEAYGEDGAD